ALEARREAEIRAANERLGIPNYSNQTSDVNDTSNYISVGNQVTYNRADKPVVDSSGNRANSQVVDKPKSVFDKYNETT
ncbi:hypothetical protein, partial [Chryseobacterium sp. SIMBA_029]|uniref:hypothetical protein n=1 Tax=Chryseobacterium sp. SIMBA_029 TaxID=3085772 RepID=UPI00397B9019